MIVSYLDENDICVNTILVESKDPIFLDAVLAESQTALGAVRWVVSDEQGIGGIGHVYSDEHAKFLPNKPEGSWTFNEELFEWVRPTPMPTDGKQYGWDEETLSWVELSI